jgi:hypothetical protein
MGLIKEPDGVDIFIPPHKFSENDRLLTIKAISESKAKLNKPKSKKLSIIKKVTAL